MDIALPVHCSSVATAGPLNRLETEWFPLSSLVLAYSQ